MILSGRQKAALIKAIRRGLDVIKRDTPLTGVEWADKYFFISSESSYGKGKWKTHPYQVAILNAMCNDEISEVNWQKSARTGYTKLLVITVGYKIEHKNRNVAVWQPDDSSRDKFSKTHIDPMIRDVERVRKIFPYLGKKHKNNTIEAKVFENQKQLHLLGGKAAKNYREISVDDAIYDELSQFDGDVEKQGSPTGLGDKRLDGSAFGKSIRGSSPGIAGDCQLEEAVSLTDHIFTRRVPCVHCGTYQELKFGGKDIDYGLKWDESVSELKKPSTAYYVCPHHGCVITYADYHEEMDAKGYWESDSGLRTWDAYTFYDLDGRIAPTPEAISFKSWAILSHNSPWSRIVKDWQKTKASRTRLKTFVNTTLGEVWQEDESEKVEHEALFSRRQHYKADVPLGVIALTAGIDTQDDRFEIQIDGWGAGEERWSISYIRLYGDPSRQGIWDKLAELLRKTYRREDGVIMDLKIACQDHGGHYSDEVNKFSLKMGVRFLIPVKGSTIYGKPVVTFPRKRNDKKVYLSTVGTDTTKDLLYQRLQIKDPGPGYWHWPISDQFDQTYFEQLTAEERKPKWFQGVKRFIWDAKGRRNEPWDCSRYSLAGVRILQQHMGLNLEIIDDDDEDSSSMSDLARKLNE